MSADFNVEFEELNSSFNSEFDELQVLGVTSWNTRSGAVMPAQGDYTLGMVGGEILSNTEIEEIWNT